MTHEVGHWFNLSHVWGSTNEPGVSCGDDEVDDTPITKGWLYNCPVGPINCTSGVVENVENYMEYSYCSKMFTLGQKARMIAALKSSVGGRNNLWTTTNLNNTGAAIPQLCMVDFTSSATVICQNEIVTFNDVSYNNVNSWLWTFPNGTTSTIKSPTFTFLEPGTFTISLKVSNGTQTLSTSKVFTVQKNHSLPYYESFEKNDNGPFISDWNVVNPEKNQAFEVTSQAALSGVKSVVLQNFGQNVKSVDELVSPPFDLTDINKDKLITLSFRYAYRKLKPTTREYLYVYLSNDCGVNWSSKLYLDGSRISSVAEAASWKPSQVNEWVTIHLKTIDAKYWQPGTRIKFMFKNDAVNGGNNLYLDDINLYAGSPSDTIVKTIDNTSKELKFIDFTMNKSSSICLNDIVTFNDVSYNNVTTWLWTFPDGSTSTIKTPSYQFKQSGRFNVSLTVSDGVKTLSKSKEVIVQKNDSLPYYESFENLIDSLFKENWIISNIDSNATFEKTVGIGNFGSSSIKLENFGQKIKSKDELISKPFELTPINKNKLVTLSFRYAYRRLNSKSTEKLSVYLSNDCGQSWTQKLSLFDTTLSKNYTSLSWKPTKKDWNIVHLTNIDSKYWQPNTRFKFVFENDTINGGNNLYLDDINLYAGSPSDTIVTSINKNLFNKFIVYPNPVKDILTIKTNFSGQSIEVQIADLVGKIHVVKELISSNNEFNLSLEKLDKGNYIVVLKIGDVKEIQKIIKE
jgi:PKD repeat protein